MEITRPKVVHVRWRDCVSVDAWSMPPDIEEIGCPIIETVGFLVAENKEFISVSVAWEPMHGKVAGTFNIPRAQILSTKYVGLAKRYKPSYPTPAARAAR